ncbi:DUF72 domain-containing protein [Candidatus Micrarchaeota archaeon]|nr:DUF72 domain-containing protein [Candidatus Micrarchaeota archaeon]
MIKVGCCGWRYFRPKRVIGLDWKSRYKSVLQAYASMFSLVEVNSTFYKLPKKTTAERWYNEAAEVNRDFEFTVKVNRKITHDDMFGKESYEVMENVKEVAEALKAKVLLFQTPPGFKPTTSNKRKMVEFFKTVDLSDFIPVWEPRGRWWSQPESILRICRRFDITTVVDPFHYDPVYVNESGVCYLRLHGLNRRRMYDYKFTKDDLIKLKTKVLRYDYDRVYVLFNNIYMYQDAGEFIRILNDEF